MSLPTTSERPTRRPLRALWLVFVNMLAFMLVIELATRVTLKFTRPARTDGPSGPPEANVAYGLNPYMQMVNPPGPDVDPGPDFAGWRIWPKDGAYKPDCYRIMFLGGSTTNNYYPTMVRDILDSVKECDVKPVTAYILAYPWQCSLHSLYKFWTYYDTIKPDLVIVLENINDLRRGFTTPGESLPQYRSDYSHSSGAYSSFWSVGHSTYENAPAFYARHQRNYEVLRITDQDELSTLVRDVLERSSFLRLFKVAVRDVGVGERRQVPMDPGVYLRCLPEFERNMLNLRFSCEAKGVPLLFLTMPFTTESAHNFLLPSPAMTNDGHDFLSAEDFTTGMTRLNDAVIALRHEPATHVFDLTTFIHDKKYFVDEVHLNDAGQQLEARLVVRYILFSMLGCK